MDIDSARQLALQHAMDTDHHGSVEGLLANAQKIYDWLQGYNIKSTGPIYRNHDTKGQPVEGGSLGEKLT
jgi:hypothetical protein